ncbi:hypothetical protein PTKIN_Ptkin10aG0080000 [Pterospermum kingtungense]
MGLGKIVLVSFVLLEVLLVHAMGDKSEVKPSEIKVRNEDVPGWVVPREADEPAAGPAEPTSETREAEAPEIRRLGKHHLSDKSMAGGGVIIGGLVTAIFAAVFAYIRVTRKRDGVKY